MYIAETKVTTDKINTEIQDALDSKILELMETSDPSTSPKLQQDIKALISRGADVNKITLSGCKWINEPGLPHLKKV